MREVHEMDRCRVSWREELERERPEHPLQRALRIEHEAEAQRYWDFVRGNPRLQAEIRDQSERMRDQCDEEMLMKKLQERAEAQALAFYMKERNK